MFALVTGGGGGFLGRHIVDQLLAHGDRVRVLSRSHSFELEQVGVESVVGDIRDPAIVDRACQGVDAVFHTAAKPGIWGAWETYHSINTIGTELVLSACLRHQVSKLIFTSSPSVVYDGTEHRLADESLPYPTHYLCAYPQTKALAEQAVLRAHQPGKLLTIALRPHLIWGPRDNHLIPRLIQRARSGQLRQVGDGSNEISMAYVENVAAAHLQACDALCDTSACGGKAYFINEPEPVNLWGWVNQLLGLAGLPPVTRTISARSARMIGAVMEWTYGLLHIQSEPRMTRFLAAQLSQSHSYSIAAAERDFGYKAIVTVDEGLRRIAPELKALVVR